MLSKRRSACCLLSAIAVITLTFGCSHRGPLTTRDAVGEMFDSLARQETLDKAVTFADPAGPIAIDIESFAGDVLIQTKPSSKSVTVQVGREARHGSKRKKDAKASLDQIAYDIQMVPGDVGSILQIRTSTTHDEPQYQRANLLIVAPSVDGLRIRTAYGLIEVYDVEGTIDIEGHKTEIRIVTEKPLVKPITIVNREGDIELRMRAESTGAIDAITVNGRVYHRLKHGKLTIHRGTDDDSLMAYLNNGKNPIIIRNVDGDIRMAVVENPSAFGMRMFD